MSLTKILPYFSDCLNSLSYEEWNTELDSESPPNTILEKSFQTKMGSITIESASHTTFKNTVPIELNLWFKTYADPAKGLNDALQKVEEVLCCLLDAKTRYGSDIKSISPTNIVFEAIDATNDNVLKAVLDFDVVIEVEYRV